MNFRLIFALLTVFSLFACQKDNIDEVSEEIQQHNPIEVIKEEIGITYRLQGKEVVYEKGFSMITQDSNNLDMKHYLIVGGKRTIKSNCTYFFKILQYSKKLRLQLYKEWI